MNGFPEINAKNDRVRPASERRWVWWFAIVVMVVTSIPYVLGFGKEGVGWRFTGFVFGVEDGNSYIAKMMSGAAGDWLFRTPYTAFPQKGVIAFLPYILLGKLTSPPGQHVQMVVLFHLFRFGAGILAILATYDFLSVFVADVGLRRFGLALATLGGGLGWVLVLLGRPGVLGSLPLDFYSPETFGFLSIYGLPHLAMARALLMWGLASYLIDDEKVGLGVAGFSGQQFPLDLRGLKAGVLVALIGFFQPLTVVVAWAVLLAHLMGLAAWQSLKRRTLKSKSWGSWWEYASKATVMVVVSSPIVLYTVLKFSTDPFLKVWSAQNLIISPHPVHYLIAYGLLVPFALAGAYFSLKKDPWRSWLVVGWVVLLPFLAYAPYNLQRRLPEGLWVALVVLAMGGLEGWFRRREGSWRWQNLLRIAPLFLAFPTTLLLLSGGIQAVRQPYAPVFRPLAEVRAFEFIAQEARPDEVVLAGYDSSNALPAWAPVRVVIGHGPESVDLAELRPEVEAFYASTTADDRRVSLLAEFNVRYVFWGPDERALGGWNPKAAAYLESIYDVDGYVVLRVEGLEEWKNGRMEDWKNERFSSMVPKGDADTSTVLNTGERRGRGYLATN
ncbi:MAG: hypothetical protein P8Y03_22845 [Anaerolineales bacterium]